MRLGLWWKLEKIYILVWQFENQGFLWVVKGFLRGKSAKMQTNSQRMLQIGTKLSMKNVTQSRFSCIEEGWIQNSKLLRGILQSTFLKLSKIGKCNLLLLVSPIAHQWKGPFILFVNPQINILLKGLFGHAYKTKLWNGCWNDFLSKQW